MMEMSSDADEFNTTGKTFEEIAEWCTEYKRASERLMAMHRRKGLAAIYRARWQYFSH